jgi:glutaredoxin
VKPTPLTWPLGLLLLTGLAHAQYKVVQPDGSVTYTDRPPLTSNVRVTPMGRPGSRAVTAAEIGLPPELRSVTQRHPVTLFTTTDCGAPCDSGRRLLQQRGVPYSEKRINTDEDAAALERLVGARTVPAVTIGAQPLRGFSDTDWAAYLDAAGYPRESKLPRNWQQPEPTPLVERAVPTARAPAPPPPPPAVPEPQPGTIRF